MAEGQGQDWASKGIGLGARATEHRYGRRPGAGMGKQGYRPRLGPGHEGISKGIGLGAGVTKHGYRLRARGTKD